MKNVLIISLLCFVACKSTPKSKRPSTEQETAYAFSKSVMERNWTLANELILANRENEKIILRLKNEVSTLTNAQLEERKNTNIILYEPERLSDTVVIIYYSPSNKINNKQKLKMVFKDNNWWVDIAYTFSGNI